MNALTARQPIARQGFPLGMSKGPNALLSLLESPTEDRTLGPQRQVELQPTARRPGHRLIGNRLVGAGRRAKLRPHYAYQFGVSDTGLVPAVNVSETLIQNSAKTLSSTVPLAVDRLIIFLERVPPEWAGPGTAPPSVEALADVLAVSYFISPQSTMPEIEVDPDSGGVSLIWTRKDKRRSFALIFDGDHRVVGTMACLDGGSYKPWALAVDQEVQIAMRLEDSDVMALLAAQSFAQVINPSATADGPGVVALPARK